MPEVGVLNLTIKDNSENAGKGLKTLAGALSAVKEALADFDLTPVGQQVTQLAKTIQEARGTSTIIKNLGTMFNSINQFSKLDPSKLRATIETMREFADVKNRVDNAAMAGGAGVSDWRNSMGYIAESAKQAQTIVEEAADSLEKSAHRIFSLQLFGRKKKTDQIPGQTMMNLDDASSAIGIEQLHSVEEFNVELHEAADVVSSVLVPRFQEMYQTISLMAYEFGMFQSTMARLAGGENPFLLGDGKTPGQLLLGDGSEPRTFLSTWLDAGEQWKTNWVEWNSEVAQEMRESWKPDWIQVDGTVQDELGNVISETKAATQTTEDLAGAVNNVSEAASSGNYDAAIEFARKWNESSGKGKMSESIREDIDWIDNLVAKASNIDLLNMKLESMKERLREGATSGNMTGEQMASLIEKIRETAKEIENLSSVSGKLKQFFHTIDNAAKGLFPSATKTIKQFFGTMRSRAIRYAIRQIAAGFSEGVQNVYQYSKAVGTSFAPAMDQAATAMQQFKNSIGAAAAPAIQALIPLLQTVVNWLITGINYLNQFFALLGGATSWTRALPAATEAFNKQKKAAGGASKAMKDLLADWDELNIIQSQSGGGGGGGAGSAAADYESMFEQVNKFDDAVKDTIDFINDHLGGIIELLKKAGVVLLGWKFSKAFSGFLGTLGKLVMGGAMISLGIDFAYGAGFDAGSKGYFDDRDILRSIVGSIATAIGGSLITSAMGLSGVVGFGIGLTIGVVATLVGYIQGSADYMDKLKWGDQEMTPEQIQQYVKSRFSFDIDSEIKLLSMNIANRQEAEQRLTTAINTFTSKLVLAKIKVGLSADDRKESITEAYESAQAVIKEIQGYIDTNEEALVTTLKISPIKNDKGEDITDNILEQISFADKTLKQYFVDLGRELAAAMDEGEKAHWDEAATQKALDLLEHEREVVARAEELQKTIQFEADIKFNLKNLTRDNAKEILENEEKRISEFKEQFMADREGAKNAAIKELSWVQAAIEDYEKKGIDTTKLRESETFLTELINEYLDPKANEKAWEDKIRESKEFIRNEWVKAFSENDYGIKNNDIELLTTWFPGMFKSPGNVLAEELERTSQTKYPVEYATKALQEYFDYYTEMQPDYIRNAMEHFGINVWDITGESIRQGIVDSVRKNLNNDALAAEVFKNFGLSEEDIEHYFQSEYKDLTYSVEKFCVKIDDDGVVVEDPEGVQKLLRDQIEYLMKDGQLEKWEREALYGSFGSTAVNSMLDELQYNLDDEGYNMGKITAPNLVTARAGVRYDDLPSYASPLRLGGNETEPENVDIRDISGDVEKGVLSANADQNSLLSELIRVCTRIANKDFSIKVAAGADWGFHNNRSNDAAQKVTG